MQPWFSIFWDTQTETTTSATGTTTQTPGAAPVTNLNSTSQRTIIECDVLLSQNLSLSKNVTQYAVEEGKPVTDSIRKQPKRLEIQVFHSSAPVISVFSSEFIESVVDNGVDGLFGASNRLQEFYNLMKQLWERDDVVTVATRFETFENMAVSDIQQGRTPEDGDALIFSVTFQEVNKAVSSTTEVPKGMGVNKDGKSSAKDGATKARAGVTKNAGANTGATAAAADTGSQPTLLKVALDKMKSIGINF